MIQVIALVGRPNVGKSTLFNALTKTRDALVFDFPGVTRDRKYGEAIINDENVIIVDTGGMSQADTGIDGDMASQSKLAIKEADIIYFMVDARDGITTDDYYVAELLRCTKKPIYVVVNKTDGIDEDYAMNDFYEFGFERMHGISASHRRGIDDLLLATSFVKNTVLAPSVEVQNNKGISFALIGRPNVGKSTLTNRILKEDRVVVYDMPGTTIDSLNIPFERDGKEYTIIDTAGVRRRGRIKEVLEKFSIVKTLQAIKKCNVVVLMVDAQEGLTDQDVNLVGFALHSGRALVVAINKWDGMTHEKKYAVKCEIERKLVFIEDFVDIHFVSALFGSGVKGLFNSINIAYDSSVKKISTQEMTQALKLAVQAHTPPLSGQYRIKPKFAHIGGHNPPTIVIHGSQVNKLPKVYQRYLMNYFRKVFKLVGTPINLELKSGGNPFKSDEKKPITLSIRRHQDKGKHISSLGKRNGQKNRKSK